MDHCASKLCMVEQGEAFCESFPLLLIYEFQGKSPIGPHSLCQPIGTQTPGIHKSWLSHWWMISGELKSPIGQICVIEE